MTTLKAVQRICLLSGLRAPSALDTGGPTDPGLAESYLDEANTEIQTVGWPENTEDGVKLTPSAGALGTAQYGTDVLVIRTTRASKHIEVVERGGALYWKDDSQTTNPWTATFTQSEIQVMRIRKLTFTDLSDWLATYIAAEAALNFFSLEVFDRQEVGGKQWKFEARRRVESNWEKAKTTAEQIATEQNASSNNLLTTNAAQMMRGRRRLGTGLLLSGT
jgi:hypothetical protein